MPILLSVLLYAYQFSQPAIASERRTDGRAWACQGIESAYRPRDAGKLRAFAFPGAKPLWERYCQDRPVPGNGSDRDRHDAPRRRRADPPSGREILQARNPAVLYRIWGLESTFGKRDSCLYRGGVNGFGWNSNATCFRSFAEAVEVVDARITGLLASLPLDQALCVYNTGSRYAVIDGKRVYGGCEYVSKYRKIRPLPGSGQLLNP